MIGCFFGQGKVRRERSDLTREHGKAATNRFFITALLIYNLPKKNTWRKIQAQTNIVDVEKEGFGKTKIIKTTRPLKNREYMY
jgi:hypothetical protein